MNEDEFEQRLVHFQEVCRNEGLKLTYQRMVIFEEVAKSRNHPDAETVFREVRDRVPTVSLVTVYRSLWMLNAVGLITTVGPAPGEGPVLMQTHRPTIISCASDAALCTMSTARSSVRSMCPTQ